MYLIIVPTKCLFKLIIFKNSFVKMKFKKYAVMNSKKYAEVKNCKKTTLPYLRNFGIFRKNRIILRCL